MDKTLSFHTWSIARQSMASHSSRSFWRPMEPATARPFNTAEEAAAFNRQMAAAGHPGKIRN